MALGCVVALLLVPLVASASAPNDLPRIENLVHPEGFPLETHVVETEDGYRLTLYHIPHGRFVQNHPMPRNRPVVYLQHGLLDTCATFLMNGGNSSLGFILAENGFDVWLGNSRGNTFSGFSIQHNMDEDEFWNFSLDELVKYDLPATLQYVLDHTGVEKLTYIGHSQGTAIAHALFSTRHPITDRIQIAFMLSPVAFVKYITSVVLRKLAIHDTDKVLKMLGYRQFLPTEEVVHQIMGPFCASRGSACSDVLSLLYGYNPGNIDPARWDTYSTYAPAGTSIKVMSHWAQGLRNRDDKRFQKFDYGTQCWSLWHFKWLKCNQLVYKRRTPPEYDLSKIQVPMIYFDGGHDALADPRDVSNLKKALAPRVLLEEHNYPDYSHIDFIWGLDTPHRVFFKIVDELKRLHVNNGDLDGTVYVV